MRKALVTLILAIVPALALSACYGSSHGSYGAGGSVPNGAQAEVAVSDFGAANLQPRVGVKHLSHIIYIMMENQGFDDVIGHENPSNYGADTPYITALALKYGLETFSFGTTHPSLPNYLSLFAGSYFGIQDDNPSCYAQPAQSPCDKLSGKTLVDLLEANHMTWKVFEQSMPSIGYLGPQYPVAAASGNGPVHYAQKHNPLVYFKNVATNTTRLQNIVPLDGMKDISKAFSNPSTAPNFTFIVPDQCHDMHGTTDCPSGDALLIEGDKYVHQLVSTIMSSKTFTKGTAIVVAWDEDDYSSQTGCCGSLYPHGGGHIPVIVITPNTSKPIQSALPSNHYSELRSIEDAFGLDHLGKSSSAVPTLMSLLP
ncbi:MAG TPA: alkaline phosphatase family protein [Candidatus Baltobacteraceae bacterium]|nr:alkaline phosphatase family protein [Candidatus Baltobacteraceae bacterium]